MDQAEQTGKFTADKPALVVNLPPSPPVMTNNNVARSNHWLAHGLVWALRGLSVLALIWGVMNVINAWRWTHIAREFQARQGAEVQEAIESTAVFGAVIFAVSSAAALLALSEALRLCVLIERNARRDEESPPPDKASTWLAKL